MRKLGRAKIEPLRFVALLASSAHTRGWVWHGLLDGRAPAERELSKLLFRPASMAGKASPSYAQSLDRERRAHEAYVGSGTAPSPRGREARRACASHSNLLDNAAAALAAFELPIQMATAFGAATPFQPQNVRCAWTQSHAVTPDSSRDRSGKLRYTPITALSSGRRRRGP